MSSLACRPNKALLQTAAAFSFLGVQNSLRRRPLLSYFDYEAAGLSTQAGQIIRVVSPAPPAHPTLAGWAGATTPPSPPASGVSGHRSGVAVGSHSTIRAAAPVTRASRAGPATGIRRAAHSFGRPPAG